MIGGESDQKLEGMPGGGGAYFAFLKVKRPDIAAKNPGAKPTEIAKLAGAEWRKLSEGEKAKWKAAAGGGSSGGSGTKAKVSGCSSKKK